MFVAVGSGVFVLVDVVVAVGRLVSVGGTEVYVLVGSAPETGIWATAVEVGAGAGGVEK